MEEVGSSPLGGVKAPLPCASHLIPGWELQWHHPLWGDFNASPASGPGSRSLHLFPASVRAPSRFPAAPAPLSVAAPFLEALEEQKSSDPLGRGCSAGTEGFVPPSLRDSPWNPLSQGSWIAPCERPGVLAPHLPRAGARTAIKATDSSLKHGLEPQRGFAFVTLSHVRDRNSNLFGPLVVFSLPKNAFGRVTPSLGRLHPSAGSLVNSCWG